MGLTWNLIDMEKIGREQNFRLDHMRYIGEEKFSEFISQFDEVKPFGVYISDISNGQDVSKDCYSDADTGILYLSVNQISSGIFGKLNLADAKQLDIDIKDIKVKVEPNDILITRSGSPGIAWLATKEFLSQWDIVVPSGYVQVIRLKKDSINPKFIVAYLNLPPVRMLTTSYACGKDQFNLSQEYIKHIPIPRLSPEIEKEFINLSEGFQNKMQEIYKIAEHLENVYQSYVVDFMMGDSDISNTIFQFPLEEILKINGADKWKNKWKLPRRRGKLSTTY